VALPRDWLRLQKDTLILLGGIADVGIAGIGRREQQAEK
jgi:hypothetical protein